MVDHRVPQRSLQSGGPHSLFIFNTWLGKTWLLGKTWTMVFLRAGNDSPQAGIEIKV